MTDVLSILSDCKALLTGHFLLSSGKHSSQYFQCARLLQYPDQAAQVIGSVADKLRAEMQAGTLKADIVVGPAMGGIVVAYELGGSSTSGDFHRAERRGRDDAPPRLRD